MTTRSYATAEAFRRALEDRIGNMSRDTGLSHDRIRKDVAFQRLIARFAALGNEQWALKGGVALLWRTHADARATRDVDANWAGAMEELSAFLESAMAVDIDDWFELELSEPRPLEGETEGGVRYSVTANLDGREFTSFRLDVNITGADSRPIEPVAIHVPVLEFAGLSELTVRMISVPQQLAEKLHAVNRTYASGDSSRAKDAYDSLLLALSLNLPSLGALRAAVEDTFRIRETPLPADVPRLPEAWAATIASYLNDYALPGLRGFADLERAWDRFWAPILEGNRSGAATWDAGILIWTEE